MLKLAFLAGLGGFFGSSARFFINKLFQNWCNNPFPLATFLINIVGCFIFGFIFGCMEKSGIINPKINALLIVGFCGGFTTFSTFSFESFALFSDGKALISIFYLFISIIVGIIGVWGGIAAGRHSVAYF